MLLTRGATMKEAPFLNLLAAAWIQFQTHDWVSHGDNLPRDVHRVPVAESDGVRSKYLLREMAIGRTQPDPTRGAARGATPVSHLNEVTHWWDASQIYGSDWETLLRLRSGVDGQLRIEADGRLPTGSDGIEETGFVRNWWVGTSILHTLFVKEHNAICARLKTKYPHWEDARAVQRGAPRQRRGDRQDPHDRVDAGDPSNRALHAGLNANWYGLATNFPGPARAGRRWPRSSCGTPSSAASWATASTSTACPTA